MIDYTTPAIVAAVLEHAAREQPREACGLIVRPRGAVGAAYMPCHNRAEGEEQFVLDVEDYVRAAESGDIVAVAHSHPNRPPDASMADRAGCERSGVPWLIVNWPTGQWAVHWPIGWQAPYEGREFVHGVHDCYAVVRDWYQRELGLKLQDYGRSWEWWVKGGDLYRDHYAACGFVAVEGEPKRHDAFIMQIRSPVPNHAAVYVGDGRILHHPQGQLSRIDLFGGYWKKHAVLHLRHRSQCEK